MKTSIFSKHIFWSYKRDANLPDEIIIEQVSLYGEIQDMLLLQKLFSKNKIRTVLLKFKKRYPKRIHFIEKVIL